MTSDHALACPSLKQRQPSALRCASTLRRSAEAPQTPDLAVREPTALLTGHTVSVHWALSVGQTPASLRPDLGACSFCLYRQAGPTAMVSDLPQNSERPSHLNEPVTYDIGRQSIAATELPDRALAEPVQMAGYIEFN